MEWDSHRFPRDGAEKCFALKQNLQNIPGVTIILSIEISRRFILPRRIGDFFNNFNFKRLSILL